MLVSYRTLSKIKVKQVSSDGTIKYLIEYPDGAENGAYIVWKGRVVRFFAETEIHQYFLKGK